MSAVQSTASSSRPSRVLSTILLAVGAAVLAAGIVVLVIRLSDRGSSTPPQQAARPSQANPSKPTALPTRPGATHVKYAQLPAQLRATVQKFVMTAVVRKNVGASYRITTPGLRQGMGAKAWSKGDIPVQYFPVYKYGKASFTVRNKTPNEVLVRMGLMATPKSGLKATTFDIGLHKFETGKNVHWKVDYWMPFMATSMPMAGNNS
jgi:hypothetical protein